MERKISYERLLKIAESMLDVIGERVANYDEAYEQLDFLTDEEIEKLGGGYILDIVNGDKCKLTVHNVDNWDPTWGELLSLRKNFGVPEVCPHCDSEITLIWDVDNDGYRVFCPSCGEELMFCDACFHADDNPGGKCDFKTDFDGNPTCFRRREHNNKINN